MRVLLVIHQALDLNSGAGGVTVQLAEAYRAEGHTVEVLDANRAMPAVRPYRVRAVLFPWAVARWILARDQRFDVIDASTGDAWVVGTLRRLLKRRLGSSVLVTRSHGLEHPQFRATRAEAARSGAGLTRRWRWYNGAYRLWEVTRSLRASDLVLVLNRTEYAYAVHRLGIPRERVALVRNGLPRSLIGLPPPPHPGGGRRIATIGRYETMKGSAYAATALSAWLPRHPDWQVTFLGTWASPERVLRDLPAAVHPQVRVIPQYVNRDLPALLEGHEIFLFPTLTEGFPVALLEAMACGLAPVVTALPGILAVVADEVSALVIPPASSEAIVRSLDRLLQDPDLRSRLQRGAHRAAQAFGWDAIAREQLELYERCRAAA